MPLPLEKRILQELAKGPRSSRQLVERTGASRKKVQLALLKLIEQHRVHAAKGLYRLGNDEKPEGIPAKLVKLGRSFGFAAALDASGDIFIPGHSLHGAMPGDEICVQLFKHPRVAGSREGEVIELLQPNDRVVGTLEWLEGRMMLVPDGSPDNPLRVARGDVEAAEGDKVAAQIVYRGERHKDHKVEVVVRFGDSQSAKLNAKAILYSHDIEKSFSPEVKREAKAAAMLGVPAEEVARRKDLREEAIFTIDSASTKDIDDAISAKKTKDGYKLSVHIADVSYYVAAHTQLDEEAMRRATSIYPADSVIPMLPKALSNGICSLNPEEDRLAFSCQMRLDTDGRLVDYKFQKTVIRSRVKGVYSEINALLAGSQDEALAAKYAEVAKTLPVLVEIYERLAKLREARGSMELDSDEAYLIMDEQGRCVGLEKRERGLSERMIEEFMLLANNAAANLARRKDIPFVYRVHDKPSPERVEALKALVTAVGLRFEMKGDIPTQKEYSALLDETRGTPLMAPVHTGVLRSMAKAKYEPQPKGHYGLGLDDYAHFTSPIRRYPDLAIHRILTDLVAGAESEALQKKYTEFAAKASAVSTEREITAQGIERSIDSCYKAEYMRQFIGKTFEGVISSVAAYGLYIALPNTVEGLLHASLLSEKHMTLVDGVSLNDPYTGESYRLGDTLRVRVAGVDVSRGNIDFAPV